MNSYVDLIDEYSNIIILCAIIGYYMIDYGSYYTEGGQGEYIIFGIIISHNLTMS